MKHGRPNRLYEHKATGTIRLHGYTYPGMTNAKMALGWRREHGARVWQAIGALVFAAYAWKEGRSAPSWLRWVTEKPAGGGA